jgi:hypothetical protein
MSLTKNKSTWDKDAISYEVGSSDVITKPNQSQTIRDILFRNTNGMSYDNYKTPYYEDQASWSSQSLNKIQDMEPTEKMQFLSELNTQTADLKSKIKSYEDAKAKALADIAKAEADQGKAFNNDQKVEEPK